MFENRAIKKRREVRYCERCGARIKGPYGWDHDDDCPKKK